MCQMRRPVNSCSGYSMCDVWKISYIENAECVLIHWEGETTANYYSDSGMPLPVCIGVLVWIRKFVNCMLLSRSSNTSLSMSPSLTVSTEKDLSSAKVCTLIKFCLSSSLSLGRSFHLLRFTLLYIYNMENIRCVKSCMLLHFNVRTWNGDRAHSTKQYRLEWWFLPFLFTLSLQCSVSVCVCVRVYERV